MEPDVPAPYCTDRHTPYSTDEAATILQQVIGSEADGVCSTPPVKPKGGDVFLYVAQNDKTISK